MVELRSTKFANALCSNCDELIINANIFGSNKHLFPVVSIIFNILLVGNYHYLKFMYDNILWNA